MTRTFAPAGFAAFLRARPQAIAAARRKVLDTGSMLILETAKGKIGEYQPAAGPFAAWAPLAETTLEGWDSPWGVHYPGKVELGYAPPDNPLLRTGELRNSINRAIFGNGAAAVGSDSPIAVWQEFGTERIPARSFLGAAAFEMGGHIHDMAGKALVAALMGK